MKTHLPLVLLALLLHVSVPLASAQTAEGAQAADDGVAELNAAVDPEDPQFYVAAQMVAQFRAELVNAAAPFDASLALDFLRATRPTYADALAAAGYVQPLQEQSLEMTIAAYV